MLISAVLVQELNKAIVADTVDCHSPLYYCWAPSMLEAGKLNIYVPSLSFNKG